MTIINNIYLRIGFTLILATILTGCDSNKTNQTSIPGSQQNGKLINSQKSSETETNQANGTKIVLSQELLESGMKVNFLSAEKTARFDKLKSQSLSEDETWLLIKVKLLEVDNQNTKTHWRKLVRVVTKTNESISPSYAIVNVSANQTPDYILANERKVLTIVFRLMNDDFPISLQYQDGSSEWASFS